MPPSRIPSCWSCDHESILCRRSGIACPCPWRFLETDKVHGGKLKPACSGKSPRWEGGAICSRTSGGCISRPSWSRHLCQFSLRLSKPRWAFHSKSKNGRPDSEALCRVYRHQLQDGATYGSCKVSHSGRQPDTVRGYYGGKNNRISPALDREVSQLS